MHPRAVITGIGVVSPVGNGVDAYWKALTEGQSGIGPITLFDTTGCSVRIGGEVRNLNFADYMPPEASRKMSRASKLAVVAAKMARDDSGLVIDDRNRELVDVFLGVACMDFETLATNMVRRHERGDQACSPLSPAMSVTAAPAGNVSIALGIRGEVTTLSTACSSSMNALGHALRKIRSGASQVIFAGGADAGVQGDLIAAFANGRTLSTRNHDPEHASRPFEAHRDGHVLSEAAGVMVMEEYEHARRRDAHVYAEVVGYGTSYDCHSMSEVHADETQAARCIRNALADARRAPEDLSFYCAHGTASPVTDARETRMLKRALGDHAYQVPVSGIKSMTGHPFGAAGAIQTITCALAIRRRAVPPTINYEEPDPACDLDYVPNQARERKVGLAMGYSLGMGNNAALALAAC
jgi:3-oxoacyl-[acyl-carrier-protein] synthase II